MRVRFINLSRRRARGPDPSGMSLDMGRGQMGVAITFCNQAEHERGDYEYRYPSLCGSEAEFLPQFFEFETPVPFNQVATPSKWLQSEPWPTYTDLLLANYLSKSASFVA
jgi:hypothetical protein